MTLPRLDDMLLFVEVVRAGSLSKAAARLQMPIATLSRRIAAFERELGARLFERSTRHVIPTEAARRYYERCAPLVDAARLAHEALAAQGERPCGHLRVSMPVDLGVATLGQALPDFLQQHPDITIDVDLSPRFVDLRTEPFDVALRIGRGRDEGLVARRIALLPQALYAAPAYLARHGRPRAPADLTAHRCLHVGSVQAGARWRLQGEGGEHTVLVRGPAALNNIGLARLLAMRGLGVVPLPIHMAQAELLNGALQRVLPRHAPPDLAVHAVTTSRLVPAAVRAFIDFVAAHWSLPAPAG